MFFTFERNFQSIVACDMCNVALILSFSAMRLVPELVHFIFGGSLFFPEWDRGRRHENRGGTRGHVKAPKTQSITEQLLACYVRFSPYYGHYCIKFTIGLHCIKFWRETAFEIVKKCGENWCSHDMTVHDRLGQKDYCHAAAIVVSCRHRSLAKLLTARGVAGRGWWLKPSACGLRGAWWLHGPAFPVTFRSNA